MNASLYRVNARVQYSQLTVNNHEARALRQQALPGLAASSSGAAPL